MKNNIILISVILVFITGLIFVGITITTIEVIGANNLTTTTKVWVWNTEPNLYSVEITPSPINLITGNTTVVTCTGYVWDYNGWEDINITNATFYHTSNSSNDGISDNNYRYINSSCGGCGSIGSSATNATCNCSFTLQYYTTSGTWRCNISIQDKGGNATEREFLFNATRNASVTINTLLALDVPAEIDYGNLSVTETSSEKNTSITNYGNVHINVSVRGWGGDNETEYAGSNLSMICDYGNISAGLEHYSVTSSSDYHGMNNLTNFSVQVNFTQPIAARHNDSAVGNSTNTTYWRIQIPLTVGGSCNGTIEFKAVDSNDFDW